VNPFTVHPVELAGQVAALDRASSGRAFLGLVAGAWLGSLGVDVTQPLASVREAWEVIRRLLAGDASGFAGTRFSLASGDRLRYPVLRERVPLLVGTWAQRLAAFAGEAADELKVGGSANPAIVPHMRAWMGSDRAGIVLGAVTVVDEDGARARAAARQQVAMYVDVVGALDPTTELEPALLERIGGLVAVGDHAAAGALLPDDVLARFAFAGTPSDVAAQAEAIFAAGALRVDFGTPHGIDERHGVELLCAQVLPRLRLS
jgi:5,10-methylenetetrahydromethanopterin reductase